MSCKRSTEHNCAIVKNLTHLPALSLYVGTQINLTIAIEEYGKPQYGSLKISHKNKRRGSKKKETIEVEKEVD